MMLFAQLNSALSEVATRHLQKIVFEAFGDYSPRASNVVVCSPLERYSLWWRSRPNVALSGRRRSRPNVDLSGGCRVGPTFWCMSFFVVFEFDTTVEWIHVWG